MNSPRDFIAFFSLPLGDAVTTQMVGSKNIKTKAYLDLLDGMVVLYRGNLNRFENFLIKDGFDFKKSEAFLEE